MSLIAIRAWWAMRSRVTLSVPRYSPAITTRLVVAKVSAAHRKLKLKKNASALALDCAAGGRKLQAKLPPALAKETMAGAVISLSLVAIDMLTGAAWVYPEKVTVDLAAKKVTVPEGWRVE